MRGTKEQSLSFLFPELIDEWNYEKNGDLTPDLVSAHSNIPVWWKCHNDHEWRSPVARRTRQGRACAGCPYCNNRILLKGFNDLSSKYPEIAKEWNRQRNGEVTPETVLFNSTYKAWWICSKCGYDEWNTAINNRTGKNHGGGCPYCTGQTVWSGHNDLQTLFPQLAQEWDYEKNGGLLPSQVTARSDKKVYWICPICNKSYLATLGNRTRNGSGCPKCGAKKALENKHRRRVDTGDTIAKKYPQIAAEWDYSKNNTTPEEVVPGSHRTYFWVCAKCNHGWSANAYVRTAMGCGCPNCSKSKHSSFQEQILFYYIKQAFPDAQNAYKPKWLRPAEIDIYIPSLNYGIEYDGTRWHQDPQKDQAKVNLVNEHGIRMLRVREEGLPTISNCDNVFVSNSGGRVSNDNYNAMAAEVISQINTVSGSDNTVDIDVERDSLIILNSYMTGNSKDSLREKCPEIANELHPTKNGRLSAENLPFGSNRSVWWRCPKCGKEYYMRVCNRTFLGQGCKQCNLKKLSVRVKCVETGEVFDSITAAARAHNLKTVTSICKVLSGERSVAAGCHWEYADRTSIKLRTKQPVYCIELDKTFKTMAEAERETRVDHHTISRCLKGDIEMAGGYHWRYL